MKCSMCETAMILGDITLQIKRGDKARMLTVKGYTCPECGRITYPLEEAKKILEARTGVEVTDA